MNASHRTFLAALSAAAMLSSGAAGAAGNATERSAVEPRLKWDLTALYPSKDAWAAAKDVLARRVDEIAAFKGHLGDSPQNFFAALELRMELDREMSRLATYASQLADEDTRISAHGEMRDAAEQLGVKFYAAGAFMRPEILALGAARVHAFMAAEPKLKPYTQYLEDLLRYEPHTLTAGEEQVAAQAGRMMSAGGSLRYVFNNAEMQWPTVTLSDGTRVRLDDAAYTNYRQSAVRADRDTVFHAFFAAHKTYQGTYGAALNAAVQAHEFNKDVHKFGSALEAATFGDNIPVAVYHQLVSDVNANLPTLHRYLRLRQRMMGVDQLRYEDLYAPVVANVDMRYTPDQAMQLVLAALAPLGKPYTDVLGKGFTGGWIDWLPSPGKASGAYSTGAYGVHPYQLQNFTGLYDEVGTLAHESGHSMHTYLSMQAQPYVTADYATFVAEVASTLNENLLYHWSLDHATDKATKLYLLGSHLDNLRGTLFRQTMFAEFELAIHEKVERGETLSGEGMTRLYLGLVRKYYGHDAGVCKVDDLYGVEWSYIPHFFRNFYVYQYATSIVASTALANGIREEAAHHSTAKRDAYLAMLASGSSKYPIDLLKGAGVDMTTSAPFNAAMKEMNETMDQMEKLLAAK